MAAKSASKKDLAFWRWRWGLSPGLPEQVARLLRGNGPPHNDVGDWDGREIGRRLARVNLKLLEVNRELRGKVGGHLFRIATSGDTRPLDFWTEDGPETAEIPVIDLRGMPWPGEDLSGCALPYAWLVGADLCEAKLARAYLAHAILTSADLVRADASAGTSPSGSTNITADGNT
ncbi:MAG: hypothetical protein MAG453_00863 [Calditrichaeota bacterium]|nr:hypothetical protein [Calditrichota bacterium]